MQNQKRQHRNQPTKQPNQRGVEVYTYTSACCEAPAKKPPCERSREDRKENKFSKAGLGHWRCTKCSAGCKVTRSKNTPKEPDVHI